MAKPVKRKVIMDPAIRLTATPQEFFQERVNCAKATLKVDLPNDVEFYIVNLLCSFIAAPAIGKEGGTGSDSTFFATPLAFMLRDASEAAPQDKPSKYRALGDTSLYITGFFQDYFNRKTFDIEYYINLGRTGYDQAARLMPPNRPESANRDTLSALAIDFVKVMDLLSEVSEQGRGRGAVDILNVYDRWTRSQSERLRKILADQGIDAVEVPYKIAQ
ncbi:hypothetical protein EBZ80_07300 [bacterium]|nr:hypothetical protein [bacterium]